MHDALEQQDANPARAQQRTDAEEHTPDDGAVLRARTQAALVRESLVRCPGVDEPRAE